MLTSFTFLMHLNSSKSSANNKKFGFLAITEISLTSFKKSGPQWHPCGTPEVTKMGLEIKLPILTLWISKINSIPFEHIIRDPISL